LQRKKIDAVAISSDLEQKERESVLMRFRARQIRILVATDVLSRGIDVKDINLVINFDVPNDAEDYVHRVGRTARASATGVALTLINAEDMYKFEQIEALIGQEVYKIPMPVEIGEGPEWKVNSRKKGGPGRKTFNRKKSGPPREKNRT
jgi:superfamily II DNA/RNA helicase